MSALARYEAGSARDADEETRLWSAYVTALTIEQRLRYESENAWRGQVTGAIAVEAWTRAADDFEAARAATAAAFDEWERCAYPLHGWPLKSRNKAA